MSGIRLRTRGEDRILLQSAQRRCHVASMAQATRGTGVDADQESRKVRAMVERREGEQVMS